MNQKLEGSSPKVRFTYQDKYRYFQSQSRPSPHQLSASYTTSYAQRAMSLPRQSNISKYQPQQSKHIKILQNSSYMRRSRRHKIFEQSPLLKRQTNRQIQITNQIENAQYKTNTSQKSMEKAIKTINVQALADSKYNQKVQNIKKDLHKIHELDIQEINRYIDRRLLQKLSQIDSIKGDKSMRASTSNQQLRKKQQQIIYLRMEVERLRRCEKINKENQSLYLRLVEKLKEVNRQKEQSLNSTLKKQKQGGLSLRYNDNQTSMNEFQDQKKKQNQKSSQIQENLIINKKINQSIRQSYNQSPSKNVAVNDQRDDFQRGRQSQISKAVTFNKSRQTARVKSHSRRLKLDVEQSMIEIHRKVVFDETQNKTLSSIPITNRLEQINCQLQRKVNRRSVSKSKKENGLYSTISNFSHQNHKYQIFMY